MHRKKLQNMHVKDLYSQIISGDREALDELIERQQSGRSLRFYPDGRSGPQDEGMIPIVIDVLDNSVCIRSGRPSKPVVIDKHVAFKWITGIPECLASVVSNHKMDGLAEEYIEEKITDESTQDFDHEIRYELLESHEEVSIKFYPEGEKHWKIDTQDCCNLIKSLCDVCIDLGWQYADAVSDNQAKVVASMYSKGE